MKKHFSIFFLIVGLFLVGSSPRPAAAAVVLVQSTTTNVGVTGPSPVTCNFSTSTKSGDLLLAMYNIGFYSGGISSLTFADTNSDAFIKSATTSNNSYQGMAYVVSSTAGNTSLSLTGSWSVSSTKQVSLSCFEWSGIQNTADPFDGGISQPVASTGTAYASGNVTTTGAHDLLIGQIYPANIATTSVTATPNAPFSLLQSDPYSGGPWNIFTVMAQNQPAGTYDNAGTLSIASNTFANLIAFKAGDMTAPSVNYTAPVFGATVSGTITLSASSTDNVAVSSVAFYEGSYGSIFASSTLIGSTTTANGTIYSFPLNTTSLANGSTTLWALSTDTSNNTSTASTTVNIQNIADITPPAVAITSPASGATVNSSFFSLSASSTDNVAVQSVAFYAGSYGASLASSTLIGSTTTASGTIYSVIWNTTNVANGSTTIWALSTDTSNNTSTASMTVNVLNTGPALQPAGMAHVIKFTDPSFDTYLTSSTYQSAIVNDFSRMIVYSPFFDAQTSWYPNGFVYDDSYAIYNSSISSSTPDNTDASNTQQYILRDASGTQLFINYNCNKTVTGTTTKECDQYAADVGNPGWVAEYIANLQTVINRAVAAGHGYKGVFIDDVNLSSSNCGYNGLCTQFDVSDGTGTWDPPIDPRTGQAMTYNNWRKYFAQFMTAVQQAFPGLQIVHNSIWYAGPSTSTAPQWDQDQYIQQEIKGSSYINGERGVNDSGLGGSTSTAYYSFTFYGYLNHVDVVHSLGKGFIYLGEANKFNISGVPYDPNGRHEYELGAYLLTSNGNDLIADETPTTTPDNWWSGWNVNLGTPLGARYSWNGILRRDFTNGSVILNPPPVAGWSGYTSSTLPGPTIFTLAQNYQRIDGSVSSSVALAPAQAAVLIGAPAPTISLIATSSVATTSITISWMTSASTTDQVNYGLTPAYGSSTIISSLATSHAVQLTGLAPNTTYNFSIQSIDVNSNVATTSNMTFATTALVAPTIFSVGISVATTTALVSWVTDQPADSLVRYGTSMPYTASSTYDGLLMMIHAVSLSGLTPSTTYHFQIVTSNGTVATSTDATFVTASLNGPIATSVVISGTPMVGIALTGDYVFFDPNNNLESSTTYQWFEASAPTGTYFAIVGATTTSYVVSSADVGNYLEFQVTPVSVSGVGVSVQSLPVQAQNAQTTSGSGNGGSGSTSSGGGGGGGGGGGFGEVSTPTIATTPTTNASGMTTLLSLIAELRTLVIGFFAQANQNRPLTIGSQGQDVWALQVYLELDGIGPASTKLAAIGPTGTFGTMTQAALAEYQQANQISPASGYFGAKTRAVFLGKRP